MKLFYSVALGSLFCLHESRLFRVLSSTALLRVSHLMSPCSTLQVRRAGVNLWEVLIIHIHPPAFLFSSPTGLNLMLSRCTPLLSPIYPYRCICHMESKGNSPCLLFFYLQRVHLTSSRAGTCLAHLLTGGIRGYKSCSVNIYWTN